MADENSKWVRTVSGSNASAHVLMLAAVILSSCGGGQAKAEAKVDTDAEASVDFDAEGTRASRNPEGTSTNVNASPGSAPPGTTGGPALLGARHDVRLKNPASNVACQCLALFAGPPSSPEFLWSGEAPTIDPAAQLVIALDSEGTPCDAEGAPAASYMGYSVEGSDTVINLEPAHPGRPMTRGAIVPRPTGGNLRISAPKALPYGKAISGAGACVIKIAN